MCQKQSKTDEIISLLRQLVKNTDRLTVTVDTSIPIMSPENAQEYRGKVEGQVLVPIRPNIDQMTAARSALSQMRFVGAPSDETIVRVIYDTMVAARPKQKCS